ncbi:MAG TPA: thioredoxin domain-containing protein [Verrucomicrobiae bacterium]|jgi:protein-disulfide isomerase|nr:thioredoxin domain-containing protein [Verrucomicrobiae bacterium]
MKLFAKTFFLTVLIALSVSARAADGSSLKPPAGVKVAVVMFEDLQCPSCAINYPRVWATANEHHVPVLLRDFPLGPSHPWSFEAAIWARFFDAKSEKLGNDFRAYLFRNQPSIYPGNLQQWVQKFADDNHVALPFVSDPQGKLKAKVVADHDFGVKIGVSSTPTIFVVSNTESREVTKPDELSQVIEDVQKKAGPDRPVKGTTATGRKKKKS